MTITETYYRLPHIVGEDHGEEICSFAFIQGALCVLDEWMDEFQPIDRMYRRILISYRRRAAKNHAHQPNALIRVGSLARRNEDGLN